MNLLFWKRMIQPNNALCWNGRPIQSFWPLRGTRGVRSITFHQTLDFCLQYTSFFNNNSSSSSFLTILKAESSRVRFPSYSPTLMLTMFVKMFFFSFKSMKDTSFHSFSFNLTNWSFFIKFWLPHPLTWYSLYQNLNLSWN